MKPVILVSWPQFKYLVYHVELTLFENTHSFVSWPLLKGMLGIKANWKNWPSCVTNIRLDQGNDIAVDD